MRSLEAARATVRACLPDPPDAALEELGVGDHSWAFLMADSVVRIPRHAEARVALEREARLLGALGELSLPVPRPRFFVSPDGAHALSIHEMIPGEPLEKERWEALDGELQERLAREVGRFLGHLHGVSPEVAAGIGVPVATAGIRARRLSARLERIRWIPGELQVPLRKALERLAASDPGAAILHGDFGPGHVLVDGQARAIHGVLDWGDACLGDPARDFIFVYEDWGDDFLALALEGYASPDPGAFLERIRLHHLADQLAWTLDAPAEDRSHGVAGLSRVLADLG